MPSQQSIKAGDRTIKLNTWQFIGNEWKEAVGKSTFGIENPSTGEEVIQVSEGKAEDVDIAVKTARKTFKDPAYKEMNPTDRSAILQKLADLMQENFDDLVALEMLDTGKTHKQCSNLDVPASIGTLRYYAGWADKVLGLSSFNIPKTFAYTKREPVGVCGQIIPWNFPLLMFTCTYLYEPELGETSISRLSCFPVHVLSDRCNREDCPSFRLRQHSRDQVGRSYAAVGAVYVRPHRQGRLPGRFDQLDYGLWKECRCRYCFSYGYQQGRFHWLDGDRTVDLEGRS
jgi:hypothetical protein